MDCYYRCSRAGNLTSEPGFYTYTYNAENEITSANSVSYSYDGNRMRVAKSGGTMYWRDVNGNSIAETTLTGADVNEYVFFVGRRVARIDATGTVYYYQADQIGSTRTGTNSAGILCYDADFTPYGSETAHTTTCAQNYKFTGYERDSETGLDYAVNRYYNSRIGRFMSADPSGIASVTLSNPQSLHRYAYVLNNPLSNIDPTGLECVWDDGSYDSNDDPATGDPGSCSDAGGNWVDHSYFQANGLADWSGNPNSDIANYAQNFTTTVRAASPKKENQDCLNTINSAPDGKFYNFFSPLSMIPGIGPEWKSSIAEDVGGGAAKYVVFKFFQGAGKNWAGTGLGTIGNTVSGTIEGVAEGVLAPVSAAATVGQLTVHAGCAISAAF